MWIFIWVILSLFILSVFGWSVVILYEQKTAWLAFARKNNLQYTRGKLMDSAVVRGNYQGFQLSLYSDARKTDDVRGQRYVSIIEFEIGPGMKTGAALGTKEMATFVGTLSFSQTVLVNQEKWKPDYIVKTRDRDILADYLTPQRLAALVDVFGMNRVTALLFFDEKDCVLHLETVDPLRNAEKLNRIVARIAAVMRVLALPEMLPENRKTLEAEPALPVPPAEDLMLEIAPPVEGASENPLPVDPQTPPAAQ
jgi:hypothetical protein